MLKKGIKFTAALLGAGVVYAVALFLLQDHLLFVPDSFYVTPEAAGTPEFSETPLKFSDNNRVMAWYAKGDENKPLILFFHGNARQVAFFAPYLKPYINAGYSVLMPEYRGFAGSEGYLSEKNMYADAEQWFDYAQIKLKHKQIVVFGYSMGTAPASRLSTSRQPEAVILMAPFYSLKREVGDKKIPLATKLLTRPLKSYKYISAYNGPLLIVHGKEDRLISCRHGIDLFEICPSANKTLKLVDGANHHNLYFGDDYHRLVLDWLNGLKTEE